MSDNIKVVVKVRPLISREIDQTLPYQWRVNSDTLYQIDQNGSDVGPSFTFDKVYDKETSTPVVFRDIAKPIVEAAIAGFNGTIFAYGQTSSGKTYTMTGTDDSPGIIPLSVHHLFNEIKDKSDREFFVRVSYIEIYNETVKDLLNIGKDYIKIQDHPQGVKVDVEEKATSSPEEVLEAMKEGEINRHTGATNMNEESSRSHSIFQITIESRQHRKGEKDEGSVNVSQLNLVDLAGSERAGQTGATGARFKEGTHINKSLSVLGLVIKQLSENPNKHANYRDSKLTRILQNSLGGNAKTSIICAVTPASLEETISTLQFANRAKAIKNKPEVNAVKTSATKIHHLTKQLTTLLTELESKKHLEQRNISLQKKIGALQKLIINGFAQQGCVEMMGKKYQQPLRRMTISTLHVSDKDSAPTIPQFCTPGLKYNPLSLGVADMVPITSSKLGTVPEEDYRAITPPPSERFSVNIGDEVINLDSDDEEKASDKLTCSPYHRCFQQSKTPPCVLKEKAKLAERNLQDIVEFTEREKIYSPSVEELMKKVEENLNVISKLEEKVSVLDAESKEKDRQLIILQNNIKKNEEDVQSLIFVKSDLEKRCQEYTIKLTDWEVSYETLVKKCKGREEELLSLLNEQSAPKNEDIGKIAPKPIDRKLFLMDLSKDISLVNSDSENSTIVSHDDDSSKEVQEVVREMQLQLSAKNEVVADLEVNIFKQKQHIQSLEKSTHELQTTINTLQYKIGLVENENSFLKTSMDNLNSIIENQKTTLDTANNDIQSYNNLIEEFQIKLTSKDSPHNIHLNDNLSESFVVNEQKLITNNENIKNVIQLLSKVLEEKKTIEEKSHRHEEILELQNKITNYEKDIEIKEKQINLLFKEAENLNDQISESNLVLSRLMSIEQENTTKMVEIQEENASLQVQNEKFIVDIEQMTELSETMSATIREKTSRELELNEENQNHIKTIEILSAKLKQTENDFKTKDNLILSSIEVEKNIKLVTEKLKVILKAFNCDNSKTPEEVDDDSMFAFIHNTLNNLEDTASNIMQVLNITEEKVTKREQQIHKLTEEHHHETALLQQKLLSLNKERDDMIHQCKSLNEDVESLKNKINDISNELDKKSNEIIDLQTKFNDTKENNENLRNELLSKDSMVSLLQDTISQINSESRAIEDLKLSWKCDQEKFEQILSDKDKSICEIDTKFKSVQLMLDKKKDEVEILNTKVIDIQDAYEQMIENKNKEIIDLNSDLEYTKNQLNNTQEELQSVIEKRNETLQNILDAVYKLFSSVENSEINFDVEFESHDIEIYEKIILNLQRIFNSVKNAKESEVMPNDDFEKILSEAKSQIAELTQQNVKLMNNYSSIDNLNQELRAEMEKIKNINMNLSGTNELVKELKLELKTKSDEIKCMESKALKLKQEFIELDMIMKKQLEEMTIENERLKETISIKDETYFCSELVQSTTSPVELIEKQSPQSLLTKCYNKIIEHMQSSYNECNSAETSKFSESVSNQESQPKVCKCIELSLQLEAVKEENIMLQSAFKHLETINTHLHKEQESVRKELQLLLEPAQELQKRIINHRTNLSTLTATTYAENKLLHSQLKVLKHHHTRYIHVCQRDIPAVKSQLHELMTILKGSNCTEKQNSSFKRYSLPDVLDINNSICNFKNESTLDGDLLMLDTNITMTTSADNTLMGQDQTCLEVTQINFDSEVACQTSNVEKVFDPCLLYSQLEILSNDNQKMYEHLESLKSENKQLKLRIGNEEQRHLLEQLTNEIDTLTHELRNAKEQNKILEQKYSDLTLEIPSIESLVQKVKLLEKEYNNKDQELSKITKDLEHKNKLVKELQEENDTLSTQIMDNITEVDDLRNQLEILKDKNCQVSEENKQLGKTENSVSESCPECLNHVSLINSLQNKLKSTQSSVLNRSLSDSESSSRYNKIWTLQHELLESKEDCKKITEEVTTIKNHLDRSNMEKLSQPMDLDESMGDSSIFTLTKNLDNVDEPMNKFNLTNIPEGLQIGKSGSKDVYNIERINCFNYYLEKTGDNKENLHSHVKIIDVMKMLYESLIVKQSNEIDNLANNLKGLENSKSELQLLINNITTENTKITKELAEKDNHIKSIGNFLNQLRNNAIDITNKAGRPFNSGDNSILVSMYKENVLLQLDAQFGLNCTNIFDSILDCIFKQQQVDFNNATETNTKLKDQNEKSIRELNELNNALQKLKVQFSEKENEYKQLKSQKDKINEIANAVTLDIVKKEQDLRDTLTKGCEKLMEHNILNPGDIDFALPTHKHVDVLFDRLLTEYEKQVGLDVRTEHKNLIIESKKSSTMLEQKEQELDALKKALEDKENISQTQKSLLEDISKKYEEQIEENKNNIVNIEKLKSEILEKQSCLDVLKTQLQMHYSETDTKYVEMSDKIKVLMEENKQLAAVNEMITKEKDACTDELVKCGETIEQNKAEIEKITSDILILRESLKENGILIDYLKAEAVNVMDQNTKLKEEFDNKCQECTRLNVNMKTHEKTVEIQSRMIMRLQKLKEEDDRIKIEKDAEIQQLTRQCDALRNECETIKESMKTVTFDKEEELQELKEKLKSQATELEGVGHKPALSVESMVDKLHRRRQSLYDSRRSFGEEHMDFNDHNQMHEVFGARDKPQDLFMDVDVDHSNGSTPLRLSKGRESLLPKHEEDVCEHGVVRCCSVEATRRRRQSTHDLHRGTLQHGSDDILLKITEANTSIKSEKPSDCDSSKELAEVRERLAQCQAELEDQRARYRELDEECETCAQYLRDSERHCTALAKEKQALQKQVTELQEKLKLAPHESFVGIKRNVAHACVNTDEDWANLHSVVVDRMSFDAEVEKNKKLTKTVEELRYKKVELKNVIAKMEKAMERYAEHKENRELETVKSELRACKQELCELRERNRELDEECDTCSEYLRERDEQCMRLREAKLALEAKLQEYQDESVVSQSVRRRRQTTHDLNRNPDQTAVDAATETSDDFLSYQVERDVGSRTIEEALKREMSTLKTSLDKLKRENSSLEEQLASTRQPTAIPTMFVATGSAIVQSQQITDVLKENHKLKKLNAKLIHLCKKRGKPLEESNIDNDQSAQKAQS